MNLLLSLHMDAGYFTTLAAGINWHTWSDMLGGIIARTACEISSQQWPERLPTNAVVKESGDLFCTCIGQTGRESIQPLPTLGWIPQPCRHYPFCSIIAPVLHLTPNLDMIDLHDKHLTSSHHFTFFGQNYIGCLKTIVSLASGVAARGWKTQLWVAAGWGSKQRTLGVKWRESRERYDRRWKKRTNSTHWVFMKTQTSKVFFF